MAKSKDPIFIEYARTSPLRDLLFTITLAKAPILKTAAGPALVALGVLAADIEGGKVPQAKQRKLVDAARHAYNMAVHNLTAKHNTEAEYWAHVRKLTPAQRGASLGGDSRGKMDSDKVQYLKRQTEAEAMREKRRLHSAA